MHETLPLSRIQEAVLEFLQGRSDIVLFGAQAVNAYVAEPRMTQDVDILAIKAPDVAEEMRSYLSGKFHIAVRIREIGEKGFRLYQVRSEGNRHLVDLRSVDELPETDLIENILVLAPVELLAAKVISFISRYGKEKSWTDRRDLTALLRRFPELKKTDGEVASLLIARGADKRTTDFWREVAEQDLPAEDDDDLLY
jgi:hypothetical protein